ncbi:MAG: DUF535 family protein [Alphaproteobacteria bacterium]|nr:DUF535 family protein [Alphaproteobacteria bacterium]
MFADLSVAAKHLHLTYHGVLRMGYLALRLSVSQKKYLNFPRFFNLLAIVPLRLLANLRHHREIIQILQLPVYKGVTEKQPHLSLKYLKNEYLAYGLATPLRSASIRYHYKYISTALRPDLLRKILFERVVIYEYVNQDSRFEVNMSLSMPYHSEGEFSITFDLENTAIFILSFTIVPGFVVGLDVEATLLISRLQGVRGCFTQIQHATKSMLEVSPQTVLVAALQGIAMALGVQYIASVSSSTCVGNSNPKQPSTEFSTAYDDYFISRGAIKNQTGFFCLSLPFREKPLTLIKRDHRSRTRKKRRFVWQISESVRDKLREYCQIPLSRTESEASLPQTLSATGHPTWRSTPVTSESVAAIVPGAVALRRFSPASAGPETAPSP